MTISNHGVIQVERVSTATDEICELIAELDQELEAHYEAEQRHGLKVHELFQPHMRFFVARLNGVAVGCGGIAICHGFAEVKRMFVRRESRGRGIAEAILAHLAEDASTAGLSMLRLETGSQQLAAIRLYERWGFRRCAAFGNYASMTPGAVAQSVFFERAIASEHQMVEVACTGGYCARSMPKITTFLTFNNQAEEAARFYTSIFPNSKITQISRYPDLGPEFPFKAGAVMTVSFVLDGREFVALNGGPQFAFSQGISISVTCDTQQEVDRYWDAFVRAGGQGVACGWLTDSFGVSWQINPKLLIDLISDPDPVKARKAMSAMMTMVKIDSEALKRAVAE